MDFHYKHIIWDWNGTLIDDAWLCLEIINEVLSKRTGEKIDYQTYLEHFDFPVKDFYEKIGFDFSRESFRVPADEYIIEYNARRIKCKLRDGARTVLSAFQDAGLTQSVLSASKQDSLKEIIEHFSLKPFFKLICGLTDHYANGKIDIGKELLEKAGYPKKETIIIGDTSHDYEVARALGIDCILVQGGHQVKTKLEECGVPVLDELADLKELLFS
jgi:phosphoglycolate phosphatase